MDPNNLFNNKNQSFYFSYGKSPKDQKQDSSYSFDLNISSKNSDIKVTNNINEDSNNNIYQARVHGINDAKVDYFSLTDIINPNDIDNLKSNYIII